MSKASITFIHNEVTDELNASFEFDPPLPTGDKEVHLPAIYVLNLFDMAKAAGMFGDEENAG